MQPHILQRQEKSRKLSGLQTDTPLYESTFGKSPQWLALAGDSNADAQLVVAQNVLKITGTTVL
jgi:hypothetical protein